MLNLASIAFALQRNAPQPLFVQLSDRIRQRITSGQIAANSRLPASRGLAGELGISRSTVVSAYEQLVAEGYLEGRAGSGVYVCELGIAESLDPETTQRPQAPMVYDDVAAAALSHPGYPDARLFPYRQWARCLARSARLAPMELVVGNSPFGAESLRASIANYLADWRGLDIEADQVLVTAGSIDALETCIRTLASSGDSIGLENPGYQPLRHIVENQGMNIDWLRVDEAGAELPQVNQAPPKMVVLTPSHQFPLGGAMPPHRRHEFQQWASDSGAWIIEDDYDSEFRYAGRPIPALASMDNSGRSIYIGTFSKVFSVSLRLGYLIMPPALIPRFAATLAKFGIKAALPCQPALARFIDDGDFYRHIRRVRRIYADRRQVLLEQLDRQLGELISFHDHQAGMMLALKLADGFDDRSIVAAARRQGIMVSALSVHYGGGAAENGLILGFCSSTEAEIVDNLSRLGRIVRQQHTEL